MPTFIKGLDLCEAFYQETVRPILSVEFPGLHYSAGLIGPGSDVLGFDTEQSTDHDWGPRLLLFLSAEDHARYAAPITELLRHKLPYHFRDYPTNYAPVPDGQSTWMQAISEGTVNHRVWVFSVEGMFKQFLGVDLARPFALVDWLTTPQQMLLSLSSGRIYHDGLGTLELLRAKFAYYPHNLWLYLLAAGWRRIAQEEPFMGRNGQVGDEPGITGDRCATGASCDDAVLPDGKAVRALSQVVRIRIRAVTLRCVVNADAAASVIRC